jgi:hypothetical protein
LIAPCQRAAKLRGREVKQLFPLGEKSSVRKMDGDFGERKHCTPMLPEFVYSKQPDLE